MYWHHDKNTDLDNRLDRYEPVEDPNVVTSLWFKGHINRVLETHSLPCHARSTLRPFTVPLHPFARRLSVGVVQAEAEALIMGEGVPGNFLVRQKDRSKRLFAHRCDGR